MRKLSGIRRTCAEPARSSPRYWRTGAAVWRQTPSAAFRNGNERSPYLWNSSDASTNWATSSAFGSNDRVSPRL